MHTPGRRALFQKAVGGLGILAIMLVAGCATMPCGTERRSLRPLPTVTADHLRADRAILAAFFTANGLRLSAQDVEAIIVPSARSGYMDRNAFRQIAQKQHRVLMAVKADEAYLWEELGRNRPLLVLLPPSTTFSATATLLIPVAWDRGEGRIDVLDGNGEIHSLSDQEFFARRAPLKHAALCLLRPGGVRAIAPTREQKLVLADFWFHRGFYRRAQAAYDALEESASTGTDLDALLGRGNILVRKKRFREAISVFRAALALAPDDPAILNNLAYAMLHGDGELLTALRHVTKAQQLDPHNPLVLETLGSIHLRLGDGPAAARYLEMAWARALKRSPPIQIAIMDQLVRAWLAAQRWDLAWQVAEHRHRSFPTYRMPRDILAAFPALRQPLAP
ncbi:MAG: tetratricopeptide repeat protein [Kiritimatiellae bacterium]|jgi:tetratricopeptide (TPR) repeat protein|nr:tetratricopeptide repeat protein [Kiritimatiellia bacterium]MDD4340842.1 tetratricopeptide repeat protein [Kiritimatiellia bacterium]MDY0149685.1 tetratricopeptide repeat protein [Kiritimatiellia bacterium]